VVPEDPAVPAYLDLEPLGKRVHHRYAYAVEPAGDLVDPAAELPACVQPGERHLHRGPSELRMRLHGYAAAVVLYHHAAVFTDSHLDAGAEARECLVDAVVDDLVDEVVKPARSRAPDVHAGPLPHGLEPF